MVVFDIMVAIAFQNAFTWKYIKIIFFKNLILTSAHQSNPKTHTKKIF